LLIEGTSRTFGTDPAKAASGKQADYQEPFAETESGGSIAFGYANANYIAYFDCKRGGAQCVTSAEAEEAISRLLLCSASGRCIANGTSQIRR
jgi:hypothetical protein